MTHYRIYAYHNPQARFTPYEDGHALKLAISHVRDQPTAHWEDIAEWTFRVFGADLDSLESRRDEPGGESDLLIACVYRLLHHRSLSVGDVVHVATDDAEAWLACEPAGWRRIHPPAAVSGRPLLTEQVSAERARRRNHS